jgi:hypothetical protein
MVPAIKRTNSLFRMGVLRVGADGVQNSYYAATKTATKTARRTTRTAARRNKADLEE